MFYVIPVYGYSAPAKSGAGIGVLNNFVWRYMTRQASFCVVSQLTLFLRCGYNPRRSQNYGGLGGASSEAPVSIQPVTPTLLSPPPVKLAFPVVGFSHCMEAAAWLLPLPKYAIYLDYRRCSPRYADN
jgi:hypothetical protein